MEVFLDLLQVPPGSLQIACSPRSFYLLFFGLGLLQQEEDATFA